LEREWTSKSVSEAGIRHINQKMAAPSTMTMAIEIPDGLSLQAAA
jgi:hypothetical protein